MEEVRGLEPPVGEWGWLLEERTAVGQGFLARRKLHPAVRSRAACRREGAQQRLRRRNQCGGSTQQGTGPEGGSGERGGARGQRARGPQRWREGKAVVLSRGGEEAVGSTPWCVKTPQSGSGDRLGLGGHCREL